MENPTPGTIPVPLKNANTLNSGLATPRDTAAATAAIASTAVAIIVSTGQKNC